jgi:hypothetical protein
LARRFGLTIVSFHDDNPKKSAQPSAIPAPMKMVHSMRFEGMSGSDGLPSERPRFTLSDLTHGERA